MLWENFKEKVKIDERVFHNEEMFSSHSVSFLIHSLRIHTLSSNKLLKYRGKVYLIETLNYFLEYLLSWFTINRELTISNSLVPITSSAYCFYQG